MYTFHRCWDWTQDLTRKDGTKRVRHFFFFLSTTTKAAHTETVDCDESWCWADADEPVSSCTKQKCTEIWRSGRKSSNRTRLCACLGKWRTVNSPKRLEERELHQSEVFSHLQVIVSTNREITLKGVHIRRTAVWPIEAGWTTEAGVKELTLNWIKVSLLTFHSIPYNLTNDWFHAETKNSVSFCIILWTWCLSKVNWHQGKAG